MSLVKPQHGRTTEKRLRAHLIRRALSGWTMNEPTLPGKPDFVFERLRIAVFVDGCFWHGCTRCKRPSKSNIEFWSRKILMNQRRDRRVSTALRRSGWTVLRVRECTLKNAARTDAFLKKIEMLVSLARERIVNPAHEPLNPIVGAGRRRRA
jgi:DNA mismatch endonuclease (patch repair protein)